MVDGKRHPTQDAGTGAGLTLMNTVAHQLRNPVATIRGLAQLLGARWGSLSEDERRRFTDAIVRQADRLADLVDNVLDVSRIDAGKFEYASMEFDPVALLRECSTEAQEAAPDAAIALDISDPVPHVRGDIDRLRRVIRSVLNNAITYSTEPARVTVSATSSGGVVTIGIADAGIGIANDDLGHVFDRFPRIFSPGIETKGTGLSLSIARSIMEAIGGRIWAESEPGRGSTFWIEIPAV